MADLAATHGKYLDFVQTSGGGLVDRSGNVPSGIPDIIWSLTPSQRVGLVTVAASVRTVGGRWGDTANTIRRSPYTTLDGWVSIQMPTERGMRLVLRGRNLTDALYVRGGGSNSSARVAAPRSFEATMTMGF